MWADLRYCWVCRAGHKMGWSVQISVESSLAKTPLVSLCSPEEKQDSGTTESIPGVWV